MGAPGTTRQDFVFPFVQIEAIADLGNTNSAYNCIALFSPTKRKPGIRVSVETTFQNIFSEGFCCAKRSGAGFPVGFSLTVGNGRPHSTVVSVVSLTLFHHYQIDRLGCNVPERFFSSELRLTEQNFSVNLVPRCVKRCQFSVLSILFGRGSGGGRASDSSAAAQLRPWPPVDGARRAICRHADNSRSRSEYRCGRPPGWSRFARSDA